jgi:ATP-dependent protease ClpP protease subunit
LHSSPPPPRFDRPSARTASGWEIAIAGDLTDKHADLVEKLLDVAPRSKGTIFFDSPGGSAFVGIGLAALIRLRGLQATGVVLGECSSAALLPFAACPRRFVTPHSSLFFHPVRWSSEDNVMLEEAAEWTRHFRFLENDLDDLLSKMFNLPRATIDGWTRPGRFLTGRELAEAGAAQLLDLFAGDYREQIR